MASASSGVHASAAGSIRAMRRLATRRANSGGGSPREIAMTVMPSGTSSSAWANAARSSFPVRASWKLSRAMTVGRGKTAKNSRK